MDRETAEGKLRNKGSKVFVIASPSHLRGVWVSPAYTYIVALDYSTRGERVKSIAHGLEILSKAGDESVWIFLGR